MHDEEFPLFELMQDALEDEAPVFAASSSPEPAPLVEQPQVSSTSIKEDTVANVGSADPEPTVAPTPSSTGVSRKYILIAAAVVLVGFMFKDNIPGIAPSPLEQSQNQQALSATPVPGMAQARQDQDDARSWWKKHRTYEGFQPHGAQSAGSYSMWEASRLTNGVCVVYGVSKQKRSAIVVDHTGQRCSDQEVQRRALNATTATRQEVKQADGQASAAFLHLGAAVKQYTLTSPLGASVENFPTGIELEGVEIVGTSADSITAKYSTDVACYVADIASDGTIIDTQYC